jgi:hypothetical protein
MRHQAVGNQQSQDAIRLCEVIGPVPVIVTVNYNVIFALRRV